jgi:hypothetical protein
VVPAAIGDGAQLLVQDLPLLTPLDQKATGGEHLWRASAQERFERLLRETGVEAGLLFNGSQLRLVFLLYAEDNALLPKDAVYEQNYKVPQAGRPTNYAVNSAAPVIWSWRCGRCPAPPLLS